MTSVPVLCLLSMYLVLGLGADGIFVLVNAVARSYQEEQEQSTTERAAKSMSEGLRGEDETQDDSSREGEGSECGKESNPSSEDSPFASRASTPRSQASTTLSLGSAEDAPSAVDASPSMLKMNTSEPGPPPSPPLSPPPAPLPPPEAQPRPAIVKEATIIARGLAQGGRVLVLTISTTTLSFAAGIESPLSVIRQFSLMQTMIMLAYCALSTRMLQPRHKTDRHLPARRPSGPQFATHVHTYHPASSRL